jgi:branched-chain amino acid transport system permease protein
MIVRRKLRTGAIGGAIILYLALIGMIEAFEDRYVIANIVGLGTTLILVAFIGTGYLASKPDEEHDDPPVLAGSVAGAIAGVFMAVCVVLLEVLLSAGLQVRNVFVSVTPGLLNVLEFGRGQVLGPILLVIIGGALGAAAAALRTLAAEWRGAIAYGLSMALGISLAEPLLLGVIEGLSIPSRWLYDPAKGGLTLLGAILTVLIAGGARWFWLSRRDAISESRSHMPENRRRLFNRSLTGVIIAVLIALPWVVGTFISDVLGTVGLYVLLGLGLNIVVGYAGLLDLGYVAFFAVGAYATGVLTSTASFLVTSNSDQFAAHGFMNFWVALPIVVLIAVIIGALIGTPVLRLRGDYLAIVTLGFGEIIRTLVLSDWLAPFLGGAQGLLRVPPAPPASWDLRDPRNLYYLIMLFGLIGAFVAYRLKDSRVGRAWAAMREDESVAEAMGVSVVRYKLLAFAIGAGVGSLGGVFFAAKIGSIFPNSFSLLVSINVLSVIILGGIGSIPGVVVGAFVLVGLPEFLREFGEFRLLIYGAILVGIMILRPEGLIPNKRRLRELHVAEQEAHIGELVEEEPA